MFGKNKSQFLNIPDYAVWGISNQRERTRVVTECSRLARV